MREPLLVAVVLRCILVTLTVGIVAEESLRLLSCCPQGDCCALAMLLNNLT